MNTCGFFYLNTACLHRSRGAICLKSNILSYESWLILPLEPYLLKFHRKFNVKEFFLETCPFGKYRKIYIFQGGDFVGSEMIWWRGDRLPSLYTQL